MHFHMYVYEVCCKVLFPGVCGLAQISLDLIQINKHYAYCPYTIYYDFFFFFRQLQMLLMLAQSNPQLFALIGSKANISQELERMEKYEKLEQSSTESLINDNKKHWEEWLKKYW